MGTEQHRPSPNVDFCARPSVLPNPHQESSLQQPTAPSPGLCAARLALTLAGSETPGGQCPCALAKAPLQEARLVHLLCQHLALGVPEPGMEGRGPCRAERSCSQEFRP